MGARGKALLAVLLAGCGDLGGVANGKMYAGADCLACHAPGGQAADKPLALAGTVFESAQAGVDAGMAGVEVAVTDANGRTLTLQSNEVGNFFSEESLVLPLKVEVWRNGAVARMARLAPSGSCNACHAQPPAASAPGRLYPP